MEILFWLLSAVFIGLVFVVVMDIVMWLFPYIFFGAIIMFAVWLFSGEEPIEAKMQQVEQRFDGVQEYLDNKFKKSDDMVIEQ